MTVSLSAVAILAIAAFFLIKSRTVGIGAALVLFLLGFFVAGTGASGPINELTTSVIDAIDNLRS